MKAKHGFTLLELMVVISIIIMLAATLVTAGMYAHKLVMVNVTENTINMLSLASHDYSTDYSGEFPPSHVMVNGDSAAAGGSYCGIQALCSYLFGNPDLTAIVLIGKPRSYAQARDFKNDCLTLRSNGTVNYVRDAWGTPLFYYRPGAPSRNSDSFDIFSAGPDQKTPAKIYDKSKSSVFDYGSQAESLDRATGDMVVTAVPDKATCGSNIVEPVDDNIKYVWDDIGNYRKIKGVTR
ncbi:type II secretion system protein [Planctomycetota bacterium]